MPSPFLTALLALPLLSLVSVAASVSSATEPAVPRATETTVGLNGFWDRAGQLKHRRTTTDASTFAASSYDYVVVGGGTAGVALAVRLSEDPTKSVGLIEAGPDGYGVEMINVPGMFGADLNTIYDWNYTTVPQSGVQSKPMGWPRGHVLGGSSALNFLVWDRASKDEYDAWEALGNPGWNWNSLYTYMKKAENYTAVPEFTNVVGVNPNPQYMGNSGPVQLSFPDYVGPIEKAWLPTWKSLGIAANNDPLSGNNIGANVSPSDIRRSNESRSYSPPAYYEPNSARPNLHVLTQAFATKVELTPAVNGTYTATGVDIIAGGHNYTVKAKKEVILSAGSVNTPQLLELSGIGNKSLLAQYNIAAKIDLPGVGENLQDHTYSANVYELKNGTVTLDSLRNDPNFAAQQLAIWKNSSGPSLYDEAVPTITYLTLQQLVGNATAQAYISKAQAFVAASNSTYKDGQAIQLKFLQDSNIGQMELIGVSGYFAGVGAPEAGKNYVTFLAAYQHHLERGSIHIASSDPTKAPAIDPKYLQNDFDSSVSAAGTKYLRNISQASPMSNLVVAETLPGSNTTSDADWLAWTQESLVTEYHPIGTASLLPQNKGGVVDTDLKVYGTTNLRVADASIAPLHVSQHTQSMVFGIAEKAADIIKGAILADA